MAQLVLKRDIRTENSVFGLLYFNGALVCDTVENASKLIPCGVYGVKNSQSPKFKRELPLIYNKDVPASRGVRIHRGNSWRDSSACVLVGMGRNPEKEIITESALAETMVTMLCRSVVSLVICEEY